MAKRSLVTILTVCSVMFAPCFVDVANAAQRQSLGEMSLRALPKVAVTGAPATMHSINFALQQDPNGLTLEGDVSDGVNLGTFSFAGRTLTLGDGTQITLEAVAESPGVHNIKYTVVSVAGGRAVGHIRYHAATGEVTSAGMDRVRELLQASSQFPLLQTVAATVMTTMDGDVGSDGSVIGCMIDVAIAMVAVAAMVATCGVPGLGVACVGALTAYVDALVDMMGSCNFA